MLREPHAYVLGLPLNTCDIKASPMVVWEGSHLIMHKAFQAALSPYPAAQWSDIDLSDVYHAARREAFETAAAWLFMPSPAKPMRSIGWPYMGLPHGRQVPVPPAKAA